MSDESVDMRWFSIDDIRRLVAKGMTQQRALQMTENALLLFDVVTMLDKLPNR